jgi:multicomponent Na+:H+ antiporter subunit E
MMIYFVLNLLFAGAWVLVNNAYGITDFAIGFLLGLGCLWLTRPFGQDKSYFRRLKASVVLVVYFHYEMTISVLRVAWEVLTPTPKSIPDIVHIPLDAKTDVEITLLANMVSLTPGTLSLDITEEKSHLIVHAMFAQDHDAVISGIKNGLEKKLLEVTRG